MADIGPFNVGYPVIFRSGGDTTRDAFSKHIQEIERIYGYLNALDVGKMSSRGFTEAMQNHVNSTNPHPNWNPNITMGNITGDLAASRVVGELTRATIDKSRVNGLRDFVAGLIPEIPEPEDKGDGITESGLNDSNKGYIKFSNGLIIQWGKTANQYSYVAPTRETSHNFDLEFSKSCFGVICQPCMNGVSTSGLETMASVTSISKSGFKFVHDIFYSSSQSGQRAWFLRYIAIGI